MTVRVRSRVEVSVSSDSNEEKDLGNHLAEIVSDTLGEGGTWKTKLVGGAVNTPLALPNVALAKLVVVTTTATDPTTVLTEIRIRRNLITAEEIAIAPLASGKQAQCLLSCDITALWASNPGTVDIDVKITVAGD